jgi:hypothetical protein
MSTLGLRLAIAVAIAGVLVLAVLIVRELLPHHRVIHHASTGAPQDSDTEGAPQVAPAPIVRTASRSAAPKATTSAAAPAATAPLPATLIAQLAADPEAFAPSGVFSPPAGTDQIYNYEMLPPFNSTTLKRTRANPAAWELDAFHGPKLKDLGPEGAVRQAVLARDSIGNETAWYAIDSGPLAPAYAVEMGRSIRVMSREYMVANRADLPPEVASTLDK